MDMDDEAQPDIRDTLRSISPELRIAMIESLRDYAENPDEESKYFTDGLISRGFDCACVKTSEGPDGPEFDSESVAKCPWAIIVDAYGEAIPEDGSGTESEIALAAARIVEECM